MTPERWQALLATLRRLGLVPVLLRLIVVAATLVAIAATTLPSWDVPNGYVYLAVLGGAIAVAGPDTGGWFFVGAAIVAGWVAGAPSADVGPAVVVAALALLAGHVACALAAAMPATAGADPRLLLRWWRPTAVIAAATVATAGLVSVLAAWTPPGSIVVVIAALAALGAAVWWWSTGAEEGSG